MCAVQRDTWCSLSQRCSSREVFPPGSWEFRLTPSRCPFRRVFLILIRVCATCVSGQMFHPYLSSHVMLCGPQWGTSGTRRTLAGVDLYKSQRRVRGETRWPSREGRRRRAGVIPHPVVCRMREKREAIGI